MKSVLPAGYSIVRLDTSVHDRQSFSCGTPALDAFLKNQANQAQGKSESATSVLVCDSDPKEILGYLTLTIYDLPVSELPEQAERLFKTPSIRTILLGRLAISTSHQNKGWGKSLVTYAQRAAFDAWNTMGCYALIVDAKDDKLRKFYEGRGFTPFVSNPLRLFIPLESLAKIAK